MVRTVLLINVIGMQVHFAQPLIWLQPWKSSLACTGDIAEGGGTMTSPRIQGRLLLPEMFISSSKPADKNVAEGFILPVRWAPVVR